MTKHSRRKIFAVHQQCLMCRENFHGKARIYYLAHTPLCACADTKYFDMCTIAGSR